MNWQLTTSKGTVTTWLEIGVMGDRIQQQLILFTINLARQEAVSAHLDALRMDLANYVEAIENGSHN